MWNTDNIFTKTALSETATVWQWSQFFSAQDSVSGLVTGHQKCIYLFPWIIEMSIDVEYYLENNAWLTFHDFPPKLWNPDENNDDCQTGTVCSNFEIQTKTTLLQTVPVWQSS